MKNSSLWLDGVDDNYFPSLEKDLELDVLIIGGGMTGLSTLYNFIGKNMKVALVEKNNIGRGVSARTTGKLTFLQENIYSKLKKYHNKDISKLYLDSQIDAIKLVKTIIDKHNIDCNLTKSDSYIFADKEKDIKKIKEENELLNEFGIKTILNREFKEIDSLFTIGVEGTYVFHPIKYLNGLKKICKDNNMSIYENTGIYSINKEGEYYISKTLKNTIKSKYVVLANHYPSFLFPFLMPLKTSLEKSYLSASIVDNIKYDFNAINLSKPTISLRHYKDNKNYLIKLTGSHNLAFKNNEKYNFSKLNLINENIKYRWSNIDIYTNDYLPYIGEIDNNLIIATGYNTWGMTNSNLASFIIKDIILKNDNRYIELFSPKRNINLAKIINFPINIFNNTKSFIGSKLNKNKSWYSSNIIFKKYKGKEIAIYIDENKNKHIVYNKCPHLKCSLVFNEIEKTWDCPCHGSRFDIDGNVIEGPSNYNIKFKER
ncbi:MAG: FAD-dependent oxidoreductase [Bacilli bacterium]